MKALLQKAWDNLFNLPAVGQTEAFLARAMLGFALYHFLPGVMDQVSQPVPVGLAHWFDLTWLSNVQTYGIYRLAFLAVAFWFASGVLLPVSLPVMTLMHILPLTLYNSQGHPHHGFQIMSLSILGMSVATVTLALRGRTDAADALRKPVRLVLTLVAAFIAAWVFRWWYFGDLRFQLGALISKVMGGYLASYIVTGVNVIVFALVAFGVQQTAVRAQGIALPNRLLNSWLLLTTQFVIGAAYLVSVCSKMYRSKGEWLINSHYVALDFVKTMRQSYYSALNPQFAHDPAGVVFLMNHANLARLFFDAGVILEIVLVFAAGTRRLAMILGVITVSMHLSIEALMTLTFYTHEMMVLIFFVNVPFIVACLLERSAPKLRLGE